MNDCSANSAERPPPRSLLPLAPNQLVVMLPLSTPQTRLVLLAAFDWPALTSSRPESDAGLRVAAAGRQGDGGDQRGAMDGNALHGVSSSLLKDVVARAQRVAAPASYQRPSKDRSSSVICVALFSGMALSTTACW